ncbi:hypothetical protein AMECASPLE_035147 [Ameca splendens]|uniref:Secreted protein n=1 Tax=Ameca splendens TaxID=208324 RepID=A0ABV0ZS91_9TELE
MCHAVFPVVDASLWGLPCLVHTFCGFEITYSDRCVVGCSLKPESCCVLLGVAGATEASRFSGSYLTLCRSAGQRVQKALSQYKLAVSLFLTQPYKNILKPCRTETRSEAALVSFF